MLPRIVRSPVEICFGTSPSQAPKSRPLQNTSPVPIAATIALEMMGPMPGTVISRSQCGSWRASVSKALPNAKRIGILADPDQTTMSDVLDRAARDLGIEIVLFTARSNEEATDAIDTMKA